MKKVYKKVKKLVNRRLMLRLVILSGGVLVIKNWRIIDRLAKKHLFPSDDSERLITKNDQVDGIPRSWVAKHGDEVLRYANFIKDVGLKNVTAYQVVYPHMKVRGSVANTIPPRTLWKNSAAAFKLVNNDYSY